MEKHDIGEDMKWIKFMAFTICSFACLLLLGLILFWFAGPYILKNVGGPPLPDMTKENALKLLEAAGGADKINREASTLLNQWGGNDSKFLDESELAKSPAIYALYTNCETYSGSLYTGTSVAVWSDFPNGDPSNGLVRCIKIEFGNHQSHKRFYILNQNQAVTFNMPSNWFQVASNIFASK
jgi:hypothetical protein